MVVGWTEPKFSAGLTRRRYVLGSGRPPARRRRCSDCGEQALRLRRCQDCGGKICDACRGGHTPKCVERQRGSQK